MKGLVETRNVPSGRRFDIDWLRVIGITAVFLFHCARYFNEEDWHVKNNQLSYAMSVLVAILAMWIMPLFFALSGISTRYALDRKGPGVFLADRARRLLVPFLFGIFVVIAPLQVWIERASHGQFPDTFWAFLSGPYFNGWYGLGGNFAWMGLHLWYLGMLFIFTCLSLPVFFYLKWASARRGSSRTAHSYALPGTIFLGAVPVFLMELLVNLQPQGIGMRSFGGWSPLTYLVFFTAGYVLACNSVFFKAMERHAGIALALATVTIFLGYLLHSRHLFGFSQGPAVYVLTALLYAVNSWSWMVLLFGFAFKHLRFSNPFLIYANDAVMPFYILHQTVIVGIGFLISGLPLPVLLKYLMLGLSSFVIIMAFYELIIRRYSLCRLLFGMKAFSIQRGKE